MSNPTPSRPAGATASHLADPDLRTPVPDPVPDLDEPIVVHGAEDLVASVPHLVGFTPERSLVLVAMRRDGRRSRLGLVARFDLPPADRRRQVRDASPSWVSRAAGEAARVILRDQPEQVVALVFDQHAAGSLPWRLLVDRLEHELDAAGVTVLDLLLVDGDRFWSYRCDDQQCCPPQGRQVVPEASAVTAEFVARGSSPLASRAALQALVLPPDARRCDEVESAARAELAAIGGHWADDDHPRWRAWQRESVRLLRQVAGRYAGQGAHVEVDEAGRLLAGLCDLTVRDVAVGLLTGWGRQAADAEVRPRPGPAGTTVGATAGAAREPGAGAAPPMSRMDALLADLDGDDPLDRLPRREREALLERFWLDLATGADGPLAVAALTALGLHVWSLGDGALASAAAERALALDPGYRLAVLLEQVLVVGMRPAALDRPACPAGAVPADDPARLKDVS